MAVVVRAYTMIVLRILNAAKEALKKVTQALAWTMNKMKDG